MGSNLSFNMKELTHDMELKDKKCTPLEIIEFQSLATEVYERSCVSGFYMIFLIIRENCSFIQRINDK